MRVIQVGVTDWITVNEVLHPVCLIRYGPAIWRATGETLIVYRVDRWALHREHRSTLGRYDTYAEALHRARQHYDDTRPVHYGGKSAH